jgi:hypothetical protein
MLMRLTVSMLQPCCPFANDITDHHHPILTRSVTPPSPTPASAMQTPHQSIIITRTPGTPIMKQEEEEFFPLMRTFIVTFFQHLPQVDPCSTFFCPIFGFWPYFLMMFGKI